MSDRGENHVGAGLRIARACAALALGLGLAACGGGAQTGFVAMNPPPHALQGRAVAGVALLDARAGEVPAEPHVEVGLIEVIGDDAGASAQAATREALRRRGADIGCDAVVVLGEIEWIDTVESARSTRVRRGLRGVCIVYPQRTTP